MLGVLYVRLLSAFGAEPSDSSNKTFYEIIFFRQDIQHTANTVQRVEKLLERLKLPTRVEEVGLARAVGRICHEDVRARGDLPAWDEATRDGFVIGGQRAIGAGDTPFTVVGELAAGDNWIPAIAPGEAIRIFTGAVVPEGGERVVPQEFCRVRGDTVRIPGEWLQGRRTNIRKRGSQLRRGTLLASAGERLHASQLGLIGSTGYPGLTVGGTIQTICCCTGSELVSNTSRLTRGQKISSNSIFFEARLPAYGADVRHTSLVADIAGKLMETLEHHLRTGIDFVVTTGGMGPGKFDLVAKEFVAAGGRILVDSLPLRPGKSILVGTLDDTVWVGLPGPPGAVELLTEMVVGPLLLRMQGAARTWPRGTVGMMAEECPVFSAGIDRFERGVVSLEAGQVAVQLRGSYGGYWNCLVLIPAGMEGLRQGESVTVYPRFPDLVPNQR